MRMVTLCAMELLQLHPPKRCSRSVQRAKKCAAMRRADASEKAALCCRRRSMAPSLPAARSSARSRRAAPASAWQAADHSAA